MSSSPCRRSRRSRAWSAWTPPWRSSRASRSWTRSTSTRRAGRTRTSTSTCGRSAATTCSSRRSCRTRSSPVWTCAEPMATPTTAVLQARGLSKSFPGVRALDRADLTCRPGRVHALVGENGAGKSTLVRILTGNQLPDEGEVLLDGQPVRFAGPREAMAAGISAVYQELTVLPAMSVGDNVMLGQERTARGLLDRAAQDREIRAALERVGLADLDPRTRAEDLSLANQQLVEIARAHRRGGPAGARPGAGQQRPHA